MADRLFGTDGVRGVAGVHPLDDATVARLGAALVRAMPAAGPAFRLLVGRDTRESGPWLEATLARGIASEGGVVTTTGIMPTPGVAYLTKHLGFDAGVVISASHNPYRDNGIKVFSGRGEKFTESLERQIEDLVADRSWDVAESPAVSLETRDLTDVYLEHATRALPAPERLGGLRLAVDCANGATTRVAPVLFERLGFAVTTLGCNPDGRNINLGCGSTHPEDLARLVAEDGYRLGAAFDGDGDRAIFVDHTGRVVDGDAVMLMCASAMKERGDLRGDAIVATVMSNLGLELGLRAKQIDLVRCPVGDKYVMEEILKRNLALGGEQSGHVIFADMLYTGDGLVTALSVLRTMAETGRELADLSSELRTFPQVLVNVPVRARLDLAGVPAVTDVISSVERRLAGQGRLLVRYSGTEPLLRVMIEGQDQQEIASWAEEIADVVRLHLA